MKFRGPVSTHTEQHIQQCDLILNDRARLDALAKTELMGSAREEAFDRLAFLAAKILKVPLTIVSLIGEKTQFFKAAYGLPAPYDVTREVPIDDSICRYTLHDQAIIAADASKDELLKFHPTVEPWGIVAFIAIPMKNDEGHVLGAFCAVDDKVRTWSDDDILLLRELTASVMTEIKLRGQIQELHSQRDLQEKFVTAISHDLRNPLNIAKIAVQLLCNEGLSQDERLNFSNMVNQNVDRADKMIQDLLTASRIRAGETFAAQTEYGDLKELLVSTIESLRRVHKKNFVLAHSDSIKGQWDVDRLRRIIENLAGNAVKYGDANLPVSIGARTHTESIEISVHNWGNPIRPEELQNLFSLFHRSETAVLGTEKGWGIGLTVVQTLTQDMKGFIRVESTLEGGTTFRIHLPLPARTASQP